MQCFVYKTPLLCHTFTSDNIRLLSKAPSLRFREGLFLKPQDLHAENTPKARNIKGRAAFVGHSKQEIPRQTPPFHIKFSTKEEKLQNSVTSVGVFSVFMVKYTFFIADIRFFSVVKWAKRRK